MGNIGYTSGKPAPPASPPFVRTDVSNTLTSPQAIGTLGLGDALGLAGFPGLWSTALGNTAADYILFLDASNRTCIFNGGTELAFRVSNTNFIRINSTGVGLNGNAPTAKAATIATPTSDTVGTKAAIDAIRVALTNIGITL